MEKINYYDYHDFVQKNKTLYGTIRINGKDKYGMFKTKYNKYSDTTEYRYHTLNGRLGSGGFTMMKAYMLYKNGKLTKVKRECPSLIGVG